jgi:hypothetical protein
MQNGEFPGGIYIHFVRFLYHPVPYLLHTYLCVLCGLALEILGKMTI